jgi:hypothetical protein
VIRKLLFILLVTAALPSQAQVYKCQEGGRTVFSGTPCGNGAKVIDATPATGDGDPSDYNSSSARLQRNMEFLREKERREDEIRAQRYTEEARAKRLAEIDKQSQIRRCNDISARIDRAAAHQQETESDSSYRYYKAERIAAEQQLARECK